MPVAKTALAALRGLDGKAMLIDVEDVLQIMTPGEAQITKCKSLGPAEEATVERFGGPPIVEGLSLSVAADFADGHAPELIIQLRNDGTSQRYIQASALAPTLLSKTQDGECQWLDGGPSRVLFGHRGLDLIFSGSVDGGFCVEGGGKPRTVRMWVMPGIAISGRLALAPGQSIEVPLLFKLSAGEYEFLAGYGGGYFAARPLASNRIGFDIDSKGKAHLVDAGRSSVIRTPRRTGTVCGRVTLEDAAPAAGARVFLWPFPLPQEEARASNSVRTDADGFFRMEGVLEARNILSAMLDKAEGVFVGAFGGNRLADAALAPEFSENCSTLLVLHPLKGFTLRGQKLPGSAIRPRRVRIAMIRGDALGFEATAVVQPDGRYEFRNVPAGVYWLQDGGLGRTLSVDGDRENLNAGIHADRKQEERDEPPQDFNETFLALDLKGMKHAEDSYAETYGRGFSFNLDRLGPAPRWYRPTAESAALVGEDKAGRLAGGDEMHFTSNGYLVTYIPASPDVDGKISAYSFVARPLEFGKTGVRSFYLDQEGVLHATEADRAATREDPIANKPR
jgi:hypothetical protein